MRNVLFVISGPSGVGKGTLVKLLLEEDKSLALSVSCTTRKPRKGEKDGVDYFFLTKKEFSKRVAENGFLEYDKHFKHYYGTPAPFVAEKLKGGSVLLEIDVAGALKVKKACAEAGMDEPVLIMIEPPDLETLIKRLDGRKTESEEERALRLERAIYELSQRGRYDYAVVNDDLQTAKEQLMQIIKKEVDKDHD